VAKIEAKARAKPKEELDVSVYACLECFKNGYPRMLAVINNVHFHRTHEIHSLKILMLDISLFIRKSCIISSNSTEII
jgi:hypothetical protein